MPNNLDKVLGDIDSLTRQFQPWRDRYTHWMSRAFPGQQYSEVVADLGTLFDANGGAKPVTERRSRFISQWIGTRGEVLTNRRTAAKTNVLSNTYGDKPEDRVENEGIIELAMGIFRNLDKAKVRGMGGFSWDQGMKQLSTWTGKTAFIPRVYQDPKNPGGLLVEAPFLDPFNLYHDIDTLDGEEHRIVRPFTIKWSNIPAMVLKWSGGRDGVQIPLKPDTAKLNDDVVVHDYWRRDPDGKIWNSMIVNGIPIIKSVEWSDHGYTQLPIVIVSRPAANHSFQDIQTSKMSTKDAQTYYHAEPFYARAIPLISFLEGLESLAADGAALAALPMLLHRKDGGKEGVKKRDIGPLAFLELSGQEQLGVLHGIADGRVTVDNAIERIKSQLNEVFPDFLVSPGVLANVAGYSFNSQVSQAKMYMVPWTRVDEAAKTQALECIMDQHRNVPAFKDKSFMISGILPSGSRFSRKFGVKDYPKERFEVDFQEPPEIPGQALQRAALATQMRDSGFISTWTGRVDMGMGQPHVEQERIDDEAHRNSPEYKNWQNRVRFGELIRLARAEVGKHPIGSAEWIAARMALSELEDVLKSMQQQLAGAPQAGFTQSPQPGNPDPRFLAPQETIDNPNDQALARGVPPTGTLGSPGSRIA